MAADETAEDRLEAALERIAKTVGVPRFSGSTIAAGEADPLAAEIGTRLDRIISTLRDALGK